jgi:hypothetical protein
VPLTLLAILVAAGTLAVVAAYLVVKRWWF